MIITSKETVYNGYFKVQKVRFKQDGTELEREVFVRGHATAALLYDTARQEFILVRQFRPGAEAELLEIVAGMVDEGESPEEAIVREIEEETGYHIDKLQFINEFYSSPGGFTEMVHLYYAEVSQQPGSGGGASNEDEKIEIVRLSREAFLNMPLYDAKTLIALYWLQLQ